jgi:chemotaxis response regulator CheB
VIGTALNGIDALEKIAALDPDVVTLDIEMPRLDGLSVLRRVMQENPRPIIMISSLSQEGAEASIEAFELGAFECIPKELSYVSLDIAKTRELLVESIKAAAESGIRGSAKLAKPLPARSEAAYTVCFPFWSSDFTGRHRKLNWWPESVAGSTNRTPYRLPSARGNRAAHARRLHWSFCRAIKFDLQSARERGATGRDS